MMLFQQQQQQVDESMSNLTSASGEASGSSGGNKAPEFPYNFTPSTSQQQQQPPPPNKKKRNLPGNPDPEAEVIALSPKTLMATNRFVCEICNKGFQRDQNLQLHRRGHNLPWKLKQRPSNEAVRKKVYVCPEAGCVHHDPARALGDLTGIKKHFSRKHGEKRWKCDKCSKRYAVQSDWKAHSKTCGTREYLCDCGTIFSRRDSFITHRAFCDALAEETARSSAVANPTPLPLPSPSHQHHLNQFLTNTINLQMIDNNNNNNSLHNSMQLKKEQQTGFVSSPSSLMPPWLGQHAPPSFDHQLFSNNVVRDFPYRDFAPNPNPSQTTAAPQLPAFQPPPPPSAHMSATALLQKAAQMGATMSGGASAEAENDAPRQQSLADPRLAHHHHHHHHRRGDLNLSSPSSSAAAATNNNNNNNNSIVLRDAVMMGSLRSSDGAEAGFGGFLRPQQGHVISFSGKAEARDASIAAGTGNNGGDQAGLTRDFLGLRALSHSDILSLAGLGNSINISRDHQNNNQPHHKPW